MSTNLFRRSWRVQVDTLDVSNLPIEFKITATIKAEPNKCVLTVWNLNEDHRAQLQKRNRPLGFTANKLVGVPVQIEAGYIDNTSVLFSGDLREETSQLDRNDWKTILAGDDGGRAFREARINISFGAGAPIGTVLSQLCSALGIGLGNANDFTAGAQIAGLGAVLPHTFAASGSAAKLLTRLTQSMGLTWSVQRGALTLARKGQPLNLGAILLSPSTGLLGSPEATIDSSVGLGNPQQFAANAVQKVAKPPKPKDTSILKLKAELIPGLVPGRQIVLQSRSISGGYYITEVEYVGQSWATDWHCNMIARVFSGGT
jgi:hypothetical protein